MATQQRPLSPHLQVYQPQLTSMMSILHRGTGVLLALAAFVLTAWLLGAAGSEESFACFQEFSASLLGQLALFAFSAALVYHFLNGLRHLAWDAGWGFDISKAYASGYAVLILALLVTAALWYVGFSTGGAA